MQVKSIKLLFVIVMTLIAMLMVVGCGKSGNRFANLAPTIKITSFEGWDSTYVAAGYDTTLTYTYQQRVYWHATDPDGTIAGYAFRVLDDDNNPVATPGYHYIDQAGEITPPELLAIGSGWVIHYLPGANRDLALDDPAASRTIWTSQKYAVINFPSADANGNPITKFNRFEVVAIDNRGAVTAQAAWRNFKTISARPKCTISTTKGNPDGEQVGAGIKLQFSMPDEDYVPFIEPVPFKYEFQMMKTDTTDVNIIPGSQTAWIPTDSPDNLTEKINEFLLTKDTNPVLSYDYDDNGRLFRKTRIIARVTDMAGVVSVPDTNTVISFSVKQGFRPRSVIYPTKTYAVGLNHYEDWGDDSTEEILPSTSSQGYVRYATPFFKDANGQLTAVHSSNLKVWIRWGWWGEYANMAGDNAIPTEDPYSKKVDVVLDRTTNENYFSEITHFDLRYDDDYYRYPPYANSIHTDGDGKKWMRIPVNSPLGQTVVLTGGQLPVPEDSAPGKHTFEIRVVDLQGETDPNPATFEFYLHKYIEPQDRSGILVIDDDKHQATFAPDELLDTKYANMLSDYTGTITTITRPADPASGTNPSEDTRGRALAFSDLQKYKLIIYHNDNSQDPGNLFNDVDGLALYMLKGGNLVISHTHLLSSVLAAVSKDGARHTFLRYIGLPDIPNLPYPNTPNPANWYYFQEAVAATSGFANIDLQFGDVPAFNSVVQSREGLATLTVFDNVTIPTSTPLHGGETLFKYGCKPTAYPTSPPTATQFENLNNKVVAYKRVNTNNSRAYIFGFPLSYMVDSQTKATLNSIINEVM